ncbi:hypothetical protein [Caminibacter sp.]
MFDVKLLKKAGLEVSKKRRYSLPVIELTLSLSNGKVSETFIMENGKLYTAQTVITNDDKIDYLKEKEIKDIERAIKRL